MRKKSPYSSTLPRASGMPSGSAPKSRELEWFSERLWPASCVTSFTAVSWSVIQSATSQATEAVTVPSAVATCPNDKEACPA
ncbi:MULTISPECIES: hypothetical protein [unclassified Corallococcus]|uniref:hypothetical protein n=1 Tax=unclassified Corallococcus TaxID=2685029 RepID=UPI001A8F829E|nr:MULTISPECIES: hypothetical protein [unclassified Corallococcus]MBN9687176.1 hypothetical protein [Corallococcus sp. NCSPR001]WAS88997.1 hypothetical protein O0N60_18940 [Corallococcus sp. NCRR]